MLSVGEDCKQFLSLCQISRNHVLNSLHYKVIVLYLILLESSSLSFSFPLCQKLIPLFKICIFCKGSVLYCFQNRRNCLPETCPCKKISFLNGSILSRLNKRSLMIDNIPES